MTDDVNKEEPVCVECEHQQAVLQCPGCGGDAFCALCFATQHRKGTRLSHTPEPIRGHEDLFARFVQETAAAASATTPQPEDKKENKDDDDERSLPSAGFFARVRRALGLETAEDARAEDERCLAHVLATTTWDAATAEARAKHVPLRLTDAERRTLRLVEAVLTASAYPESASSPRAQVRGVCAVLTALLAGAGVGTPQAAAVSASASASASSEMGDSPDFAAHAEYLRGALEVARRYKVLNPDRLRTAYAPLVHVLQDSRTPAVRAVLECDLVAPLATVHRALSSAGALALLRDPALAAATAEIGAGGTARRREVALRAKRAAVASLCARHASPALPRTQLCRCLYSLADSRAFLRVNRDPVDKCILWLQELFPLDGNDGDDKSKKGKDKKKDKNKKDKEESTLAIYGGVDGARLTHSHDTQHLYVLQSLALWREVQDRMHELWALAEADLLGGPYVLRATGQGVQRVQAAPRLRTAVDALVVRAQTRARGRWVGSTAVHLGDAQVPNALLFIDKYTQVPRILGPLVHVLDRIDALCGGSSGEGSSNSSSEAVKRFVRETYGSPLAARRAILGDFFRRAFDGSGADNFFDAGSCIDGRLTSAWNWCATIESKPFYYLFLLAGFTGFDGEWK